MKKLTAKLLLEEVREIKSGLAWTLKQRKRAGVYLENDVVAALLFDGIPEKEVKEILSILYKTVDRFPSGSSQQAFWIFLSKVKKYGFSPNSRSFRIVQQYFSMLTR